MRVMVRVGGRVRDDLAVDEELTVVEAGG
jgi:hypothetical protein